jgi:hypothetical protein
MGKLRRERKILTNQHKPVKMLHPVYWMPDAGYWIPISGTQNYYFRLWASFVAILHSIPPPSSNADITSTTILHILIDL